MMNGTIRGAREEGKKAFLKLINPVLWDKMQNSAVTIYLEEQQAADPHI